MPNTFASLGSPDALHRSVCNDPILAFLHLHVCPLGFTEFTELVWKIIIKVL